ncbi:ATP-binding protein [Pyrofollis japonicus]|uniref:ATP-binding protein n=1 Tax=Pyrofollis japonicus TaxID=3060460 RepID=UPI00295A93FD|nr:ATP-binding protein [Pyrofollis japonicus]BEP18471.1 ATP-binding protein [Pyrofollis japonicus]
MTLNLQEIGEEIGIVLSNATASLAPIALRRDKELDVREEDLVIIRDEGLGDGYYMLGVIRWITRYEPFLRRSVHNVYIEHPEALSSEVVMPFSNAFVEIYGAICDGGKPCTRRGFVSNVYPPTPGSKVYKLVKADDLSRYLTVAEPISVGVHKYSDWRLPLDSAWLNYHIGVFGATGTGKSRLILRLITEIVRTGYGLIVFDHNGVDYAPFAEKIGAEVIDASSIRIEPKIFASIVGRLVDVQGTQRDVVEVAALCYAMKTYRDKDDRYNKYGLEECGRFIAQSSTSHHLYSKKQEKQSMTPKEEFIQVLDKAIRLLYTRGADAAAVKLKLLTRLNIPDYVFEKLRDRVLEPEDIVLKALKGKAVVIDMSTEQDIEVKRGIIASVASAVWSHIAATRSEARLGLVVDEAQNYACEYCGEAGKALETIAREGRKWKYFIIVASQRVSRDIRPGVRSNLGTVFFSRLQASGDLQELSGYLDLGRVSEANLAMLARREFYVAGLMNPLRRPMLLLVDDISYMKNS